MTKKQDYQLLLKQAQTLLDGEKDIVANMSNLVSLIFHSLTDLNGTTFYRNINHELVLGPFQGKPACMHIPFGKGVCGTVAQTKRSEIVPDVTKFDGHIACDAASKSEIVVPAFYHRAFWGVLDLDSPHLNRFDSIDEHFLLQIAPLIFADNDEPITDRQIVGNHLEAR
ncbi:GAF domain-containing protein [Lentilactobacillus hilgardii]|uniref:GAF domain-containing protein n=1 Tax=Lentilactobacillus hilgardii TaxID=1588 RepID=A0A6P1E4G2_LENHI|nr:GAF domain-containing protein [Lentilactobacillus hilgardii]EEI71672.1 hypothetical protein HMPREF0496_1091 [Lentilactobacillus hilgardii ATCC 27305]MCT3392887.1 GAF domain-containing protein [Lentilactobacillus hilgardii]QHB51449.1 GAF domain-containing protein [Lentilactobacillus hilgardii]RRG08894.1 MAG: GAF domain-containing protein [Lactobacillus sp.]